MEYPPRWTCEVILVRLEGYLLRTLPLGEALAVAEHLEACASCTQWVVFQVEQRSGPRRRDLAAGEPRG